MSGGLRLSLAVPGASASELLAVARWADDWSLATLWIGDPRGQAPNRADSYVTSTAGAVAAVTEDLRIGLLLGIADERQVVRLAEDVAVADQASAGRVELGFVPPGGVVSREWGERVARLLRAWTLWQLPGRDETVAVIPGPAQPVVPRVVVDSGFETPELLGAGRMVLAGTGARSVLDGDADAGATLVPRRTIRVVAPELGSAGVIEWIGDPSAYERALELRGLAAEAGAQELLLSLPGPPTETEVKAIGTVLVPSLRCADRDLRAIATDAWTWITSKAHLQEPPAG